MDLENLRTIKKLVLVAMFSDDEFLDRVVLKGGNALDLAYGISSRASVDLDFSINGDMDTVYLSQAVSNALKSTFAAEGYHVYDISVLEVPPHMSEDMSTFWGGYQIEFKIVENSVYKKYSHDINSLRRNSMVVGPLQKKKFRIDISKHEHCEPKNKMDLDGYTIFVYAPELLVAEKLRAICQQIPDYRTIATEANRRPRARDFVDIHDLVTKLDLEILPEEHGNLIETVFVAKRVPISYLGEVSEYREYHRQDFVSVKDTVYAEVDLKGFDYYFDFVLNICKSLESLWKM